MNSTNRLIVLSADLGELCGRVDLGLLDADGLLLALCQLFDADGAMLGLPSNSGARHHAHGLDGPRAERLCGAGLEPPALTQLCGPQAVVRLCDLGARDEDPVLLDLEGLLMARLGAERLLRVAAGDGVLLLCRFAGRKEFEPASVTVLGGLRRRLAEAFVTLARLDAGGPRLDPRSEPSRESDLAPQRAWERCSVPLVLLDSTVTVLGANPAARRKLDMDGTPPTLPRWIDQAVRVRLAELVLGGGLPDDVSGDYQFVRPGEGRRVLRLGLVPVESPADHWILSVEHGGPTLHDRIDVFARHHGLTDRERETVELLAEGLTNQRMSERLDIKEPSVKARMGGIMEKTGTGSRTDLLAAIFACEETSA